MDAPSPRSRVAHTSRLSPPPPRRSRRLGAALPWALPAALVARRAQRETSESCVAIRIESRICATRCGWRRMTRSFHAELAALPALLATPMVERRRVDAIFWEAAARGETYAPLGTWAMEHPSITHALI